MSATHRKCDASNYETKQLVICSSVKMLSTTGERAGWSIEGRKGGLHGHGTTLLRVPTRKILWQLVNKPQLPSFNATLLQRRQRRRYQQQVRTRGRKTSKAKSKFSQKFMQNYFVKFALRPLFWVPAPVCPASWTGGCLSLLMMADVAAARFVPARTSWSWLPVAQFSEFEFRV